MNIHKLLIRYYKVLIFISFCTLNWWVFIYIGWLEKTKDFDFTYKKSLYFLNGFVITAYSYFLYDTWVYQRSELMIKLGKRFYFSIPYEAIMAIMILLIIIYLIPIITIHIIEKKIIEYYSNQEV